MRLIREKDWEMIALKVINGHKGKRKVYETYLKLNPEMAREYARFISKNKDAIYISWDKHRKRFVA
ncbi:MAG: hypothetical protein JW731_04320 [Bacteroidales bacterium]|nr:hypothetical protein [Bacteroidales bacterium]